MRFLIRSLFKLLKNDMATALSRQLPRRLMLGSRWYARQKRRHASLPNCEPDRNESGLVWACVYSWSLEGTYQMGCFLDLGGSRSR